MKKRYWLFSGMVYYPSGGMDDFDGSFDTLEQCKDHERWRSAVSDRYNWAHIYDSETGEIFHDFD